MTSVPATATSAAAAAAPAAPAARQSKLTAAVPPLAGPAALEKKPINSFLLFSKHTRAEVVKNFPSLGPREIAVKLGELWCATLDFAMCFEQIQRQ